MTTAAPARAFALGVRPAPSGAAARWPRWQGPRLLSRRTLRRVLGALWLLDALVQAEPSNFGRGYPLGELLQSIMGAPGWERRLVVAVVTPFSSHWPWWNLAAVVLQGAIGLALVTDRWTRPALVVAWGWCAVVWLVGEGLGMVPTGFALLFFGAPGPAVLYAVLGILAWPSTRPDVDRPSWVVAWTAYWAGGALLQLPWVYPGGQVLRANVEEASLGQPGWLEALTRPASHLVVSRPLWWLAGLGAAEVAIALGALGSGRAARAALGAAVVLSGAFWVVGQQLGGVLAPGASDPGTAPLVILLALAAWPVRTARLAMVDQAEPARLPSASTASASFTTCPVKDCGVCIASRIAAST